MPKKKKRARSPNPKKKDQPVQRRKPGKLTVLTAVVLGVAMLSFGLPGTNSLLPGGAEEVDPGVFLPRTNDIVEGREDAAVEAVKYVSLACVHCAETETTVMPSVRQSSIDPGHLRLTTRLVAFSGPDLKAAAAVACLATNAARRRAASHLLANQDLWTNDTSGQTQISLVGLKLEGEELDECLERKTNEITADTLRARNEDGIRSTPTLLLPDQRLSGTTAIAKLNGLVRGMVER